MYEFHYSLFNNGILHRQSHGEYPVYPTDDEGGSDVFLKTTVHEENGGDKVSFNKIIISLWNLF